MPDNATFASFQQELARLVETFGKNLAAYKSGSYDEASLRQEFLNPFFRALGWDIENNAGLIPQHREVEIESRTQIGGRQKRADYLFRNHPTDRFVCEAKKPAEELHATYAFQAKRYAWNKGVALAVLTDFEEMKVFIVGGKPFKDEPNVGLWKTWHFREYPLIAQELWNLLARERVAAGSIDQLIESLPKRPAGKGKAKQGWLIKPDRSRALDTDFLNFLDEARRELAADLLKHNDRADLLEGTHLNEAVQRILDRILFLRICEDRDIDTGRPLDRLVRAWRDDGDTDTSRRAPQEPLALREEPPGYYGGSGLRAPKGTLWHALVRHFRSLDRRPPSHNPFFNGNLFKPHFSEELIVSDDWLARFLDKTGGEDSPYLFHYIPVEILGTIYERFLGKIVRPHGRGVTIEEKPEVRKAGGVYYTPRYIVEYIVAQTVGKLLAGKPPEDALKLRILDPACGSGSFLIRAFEQVCEHCQQCLTDDLRKGLECAGPPALSATVAETKRHRAAAPQNAGAPTDASRAALVSWLKKHREWCWLDEAANALHLTTKAKRRILRETIHGVDLDPQAVEVTQLSLYLKMLEGENRFTLARERDLFGSEEALLPPLQDNIKCGNSLIASDFSVIPEDLVRVHAFDWPVQFPAIMKAGGFDAVVGNPPYGADVGENAVAHLREKFESAGREVDSYALFMEQGFRLTRPGGMVSMIVPTGWYSGARYPALRRYLAKNTDPTVFINLPYDVFADAWVDTTVFAAAKRRQPVAWPRTEPGRVCLKTFPKRHRIKSASEFDVDTTSADVAAWFQDGSDVYLTYANETASATLRKIEKHCVPFSTYADIQRGVTPFNLTDKPTHKTSRPAFEGTVRRYLLDRGPQKYVRFDDTLMEPKPARYFEGPRLLIRELISRQFQIQAVKASDDFVTNKSMQSALALPNGPRLEFLLGCFNSKLLSWYFLQKSNIAQRDDFPKIVLKETRSLPFPKIDLKKPADRARHDRLVALVDKMLALTPKLHAAKSDAERATLQNAVTATDQQIDALVYELYGLTEDEIKLVEGVAS